MKLYSYYRSSTAYRVRIALNFKQIDYDIQAIHLVKNGGEQHDSTYLAKNPQGLVPLLETGQGLLSQSMAMLEYLEETHPTPSILPDHPWQRAQCRMLANIIACDIHPINNLRILNYLKENTHLNEDEKTYWIKNWIDTGLQAYENWLNGNTPIYNGHKK